MKNTDIIITNYAPIKQKEAKITCLCDSCLLSFVLLFYFFSFVCNLARIGKPFQKLVLRVLPVFPNTQKHQFLVSGNSSKTLATVLKYYFNSKENLTMNQRMTRLLQPVVDPDPKPTEVFLVR